MSFVVWWNELSVAAQIFYCVALPSTLLLLIQTILMFIGFGNDSGIDDGDIDDIGDVAEDAPDVGEDLSDASGLEGLRIFTIRGIIAFCVVFGWVGVVMEASGVALWITLPVAFICGVAMMFALAFLFNAVMKLRSDGNKDNRNTIGTSGRVHLTIPASRKGEGKVHIMLQGSYVERGAVTDEDEPIPTGSEVVVVGISGQTDLVVKRK